MSWSNKFYALEGDRVHNDPGDYLQSVFAKRGISFVHHYVALLTQMDRWGDLHPNGICLLDHRHWQYDDSVFCDYVHKVAESHPCVVRLADSPFVDDRPSGLSDSIYEQMLYNRIISAAKILRKESPQTTIISPSIEIADEATSSKQVNMFHRTSGVYDAYMMKCDIDGSDREIGILATLLNKVLKKRSLHTWVLWTISACDHEIPPIKIGDTPYRIQSSRKSSQRVKPIFNSMEIAAKGDTTWFFSGAGRDKYGSISSDIGCIEAAYDTGEWGPRHFMGLCDKDGCPKKKLINAFLGVVKSYEKL